MLSVGTNIYAKPALLDDQAAAAYLRARAAGLPAGITSALRTNAEQVALFLSRYKAHPTATGPYNDIRWWNGTRYYRALGAGVAVPGSYYSRHEKGLSLDLPDEGGARAWMRAHGWRFGWIKDIVTNEPWHFEYQAHRDTTRNDTTTVTNPGPTAPTGPTGPDVTAPKPIKETDDMTPAQAAQLTAIAEKVQQIGDQVTGIAAELEDLSNVVYGTPDPAVGMQDGRNIGSLVGSTAVKVQQIGDQTTAIGAGVQSLMDSQQ